ncbi:MAG: alpha/beta hydrolase [Chloroflexota bacterium]
MEPEYIELSVADHQLAAVCLNPGAPGEPVVLIHGITSTVSFWQVNPAPYLLEIGPCYSLSLPGHYPARAPQVFKRQALTSEALVELLDSAVQQLVGERPVTLFGHSTGGFACLALAAQRPEVARRVVSISGFAHGRWTGILGVYQRAARLGWPGQAYFKAMYLALRLHPALFRWAMRFYVADWRALYANSDLPEAIQRTFPSYCRLDLDAMLAYFKHMPDIDITSRLPRIQAQTLVITGDHDPIVPPAQSYRVVELVEGAELAVVHGAGHLPFTERPNEYHDHVSAWLARTHSSNK